MAEGFTYENGLRIVTDYMAALRTVSVGVWVGAGSGLEGEANNGISHFIEHMLFKGTKNRSYFQIADDFERLGANINAFTGKENTCYYFKAVDEYAEQGSEILADIFFNSVFDKTELEREKQVVIEEINMVEDSPEDLCFDLLAKCVYGSHPLGKTILGPAENIKGFTKKDITAYMGGYYNAANTVLSFAGNITLARAKEITEKYFLPLFKSGESAAFAPAHKAEGSVLYRFKDIEQANVLLRFPCYPTGVKRKNAAASFVNMVLGGSMSSRLFQSLREKQGLAYSVYSLPSTQKNNGSFTVFCNISPANTEKAIACLKSEIIKLKEGGITESEFERCRNQIKSAFVFGQESAHSTMTACGKIMLMTGELYNPDERIREINSITMDEVMETANEIFDFNKASLAYLGKEIDTGIIGI